jgi:hypothetical protein
MAGIQREDLEVLSEQFQERMTGRRLVAGVFLTFRFDPAFFEQEVLPVFLDIPLSHATAIKLVQLEEALRSVPRSIAVYYDQNGLVPEAGPAKLDLKRLAVQHRTGIFHPKNVFLLVEDDEADDNGRREQALLVACMSANLTQSGWWENVEVCHLEEIRENEATRIRGDLLRFLEGLERRVGDKSSDRHDALRAIREFLRLTEQRQQRTSGGLLHPHFFYGRSSVADFLREACGGSLDGTCLEIISPYFDALPESAPLKELINGFRPREVRMFLPRNDSGEALCSPGLYEWVCSLEAEGVRWGRLPKDILRRGKGEDIKQRFVHAKVYRFFTSQPKREILFVGSVNLTRAAHQTGGNLETGFLVEVEPARRPEWWLDVEGSRPKNFKPSTEDEGMASSGGTRLSLRYWWNKGSAEVYWDDTNLSPHLTVENKGVRLFEVENLSPRTWTPLDEEACAELKRILRSTSMLTVLDDTAEPGLLLVQEEGMSHKPSLLLDLSPAEILRYWSLLTVEQRAAAIEVHAVVPLGDEGSALVAPFLHFADNNTLFDRFAGIFHAFGCLERSAREALREGKEREATYRIFGQKYDSLGNLLTRVMKEDVEGKGDAVEHYVIMLCAHQVADELERNHPDFWREHAEDAHSLRLQLDSVSQVRGRLVARDPERMPQFLTWFDRWFLQRATPVEREEP